MNRDDVVDMRRDRPAGLKVPPELKKEILHLLLIEGWTYDEILDQYPVLKDLYKDPRTRLRNWVWSAKRSDKWKEEMEKRERERKKKELPLNVQSLVELMSVIQLADIRVHGLLYQEKVARILELEVEDVQDPRRLKAALIEVILEMINKGREDGASDASRCDRVRGKEKELLTTEPMRLLE